MAVARPHPHAAPGGRLAAVRARASWRHAAVAAALAAYVATRASMADRFPYIGDEGWHGTFVVDVGESVGNLWVSLTIAKEPLAIWIAALIAKLGVEPMDAMRAVSVLAGLGTVVAVGLFARHADGRGAGLAALAIGAALPFWLVLDAIGLMDALIAAEVAGALYLQVRLAERPSLRTALGLGLLLAAAVLTKESGKSAVALMPLSLLCFDWAGPRVRERLLRWAGLAALAAAMAGLAYLWMRSSDLWSRAEELRRIPIEYPVRPLGAALEDPLGAIRANAPEYRTALLHYFTVPFLAAAAWGATVLARERRGLALLLGIWIVVPVAAALLLPYNAYARHVMFATPALVVLAGIGLARAAGWAAGRWGTAAAALGVAVAFSQALWLDGRILADPATARYPGADDWQYVTGPSAGAIWPGVVEEIRARTGGRPTVVLKSAAVTWVPEFLLDDPDVRFVYADHPRAPEATLAVQDALPFPDVAGRRLIRERGLRLVRTFERPRGGAAVRLYERGAP